MEIPSTVRWALWFIGIPIAVGAAGAARVGEPLWSIALGLVLPGLLLWGAALRRNWARLAFATLVVITFPLGIVSFLRQLASSVVAIPFLPLALTMTLTALEITGVVLLLLPKSGLWYHGRPAA